MCGYGVRGTPARMPLPIQLAHALTRSLARARRSGSFPELRPDGKSQVTVDYEDGRPRRVATVVLSTQHADMPAGEYKRFIDRLTAEVIRPVLPRELIETEPNYLINPTGRFVMGGPRADTGLTGRKIIVDSYGGFGGHGGGCFSGKDPSKVDRSGSYAARHVAKNIVASGLARRCEVQLAYAIGVVQPLSVLVTTFGTSQLPEEVIERAVREQFDLS